MAGPYLLGGNLLLPIVIHILANMRVLLIFRPENESKTIPEGA
jgi:hypothetical protein